MSKSRSVSIKDMPDEELQHFIDRQRGILSHPERFQEVYIGNVRGYLRQGPNTKRAKRRLRAAEQEQQNRLVR